jgi:hypothetical protein
VSLQTRVYSNGGAGGPVDYSTPLASVAGLSYLTAALTPPGDWTFAVRNYDTVTGLEEDNTDARARLVLDASGADVTGRPAAPTGLTAGPLPGGRVRLTWAFDPGTADPPTGFRVYLGTPTPNFTAPAATVAYARGRATFSWASGALPGGMYEAVVRAYNAAAEEPNADAATFAADPTGPDPVDALAAAVVP